MTTQEDMDWSQGLRERFLKTLWDLEQKGVSEASVLKVLALSGAGGITEDEADHVVRKLRRDGLIMAPTRLKRDIFNDSTALTVEDATRLSSGLRSQTSQPLRSLCPRTRSSALRP